MADLPDTVEIKESGSDSLYSSAKDGLELPVRPYQTKKIDTWNSKDMWDYAVDLFESQGRSIYRLSSNIEHLKEEKARLNKRMRSSGNFNVKEVIDYTVNNYSEIQKVLNSYNPMSALQFASKYPQLEHFRHFGIKRVQDEAGRDGENKAKFDSDTDDDLDFNDLDG